MLRSGEINYLSLVIAAWCRYLNGQDDQGNAIAIDDLLADLLKQQARIGGLDSRPLLSLSEIFGEDLHQLPQFIEAVTDTLSKLYKIGARAMLVKLAERHQIIR
ncbi:MAG: hypothetical protein KME43_23915 [Myxacorys chilensis ATA2-1-KO14]|nr:hypothetical protein [Myxacorys chilensis ATA2-1-KO14]